MSFVKHQIGLPNTGTKSYTYKMCAKCDARKPAEGGIEMSPARWICASCWTKRVVGQRKKVVS